MFRSLKALERARREGGEDQCRKLQEQPQFKKMQSEDKLLLYWGQTMNTWPWYKDLSNKRVAHQPLEVLKVNKYPLSDQHALFSKFSSDLLAHLSPGSSIFNPKFSGSRIDIARLLFRQGTSFFQRFLFPPLIILYEVLFPLLVIIFLVAAQFVHLAILFGLRFPALWLCNFTVSGSEICGREVLLPGENGYSRVFRGGEDIDLDELEAELMTRNSETFSSLQGCSTIAISYKHYANRGKVPGDDNKICRTDLQAIARLIKDVAPCNLRFWVDGKLPSTNDATFERWIVRGVRPYGRYITFICPSAFEYANTSFWLANEYHIAAAAKGVMYLEGDQLFFELKYGYNLDLYRRFLQVTIGAEDCPVQVRDEDKGKVIHWAMCCLGAFRGRVVGGEMSPCIDNLTMAGEHSNETNLFSRISTVVRKFGPQELPVTPERSWNAKNPLLMGNVPHLGIDLSNWYGYCLDGFPMTIYYVHHTAMPPFLPTIVVLEVTLDKPHFSPGKIRVQRKILLELESDILMNCKFVMLPWLCEWT